MHRSRDHETQMGAIYPLQNQRQVGPKRVHIGEPNMGWEKAYTRLYKWVYVKFLTCLLKCSVGPNQRSPHDPYESVLFLLKTDTTFSFLSLAKIGKIQKIGKKNDAGSASLFADLAIEPSKLPIGCPCCLTFTHKVVNTKTKWKGAFRLHSWPSPSRDLEHVAIDN